MGYFYRNERIIIRNVGEFFCILSDTVDRADKSGYNNGIHNPLNERIPNPNE